MKIDHKSQIGGQPLKLVRDFLRRQRGGYISVENIVEHLQQNCRLRRNGHERLSNRLCTRGDNLS